jgi:type IV pilus assembly protein PilC
MSNRFLARELDVVRGQVQEGRGFAEAMRARGVFPDVAVKMVEVGESTGALQEMLNSIADFYDEEIETEVTRFMTFIEPVMLIVMGIIIAVVVLALYMPIIQLSTVVG